MKRCVLAANGKINLTLDVVGQRADGYHLLDMVMQSVSLHDVVTLECNDLGKILLTCDVPEIPCDERNIAYRCAALLLSHCQVEQGVTIHLEKHIPSQAGLGGGSADGAAVLVGLNELLELGLSQAALCQLGVQIGTDIPFCIVGGTQRCTGIGEVLSPLPALSDCAIVLCKPPIDISTGEAYGKIDNGVIASHPDNEALVQCLTVRDFRNTAKLAENVFLSAMPLEEVLAIRHRMLDSGAAGASMSGSGSAVFGLFHSFKEVARCAYDLKKTHPDTFMAIPARTGVEILERKF